METGRTRIIVGHYGSGKTEFAVNLAFALRAAGRPVAVADLDIVNPYFRARQKHRELEAADIEVASNNFRNDWKMDLPALSRELATFFTDRGRENIVDVGGNGVGARILARFRDTLRHGDFDVWMVVNARRYETQTTDALLGFLADIEQESGLRVNGFVGNTHMLRETTLEDLLAGEAMLGELTRQTGVPCRYTAVAEELMAEAAGAGLSGELLPIRLHMRQRYL